MNLGNIMQNERNWAKRNTIEVKLMYGEKNQNSGCWKNKAESEIIWKGS